MNRNYPAPTPCTVCGFDTIGTFPGGLCRRCNTDTADVERGVTAAYKAGEIERDEWTTKLVALHTARAARTPNTQCTCMACTEARNAAAIVSITVGRGVAVHASHITNGSVSGPMCGSAINNVRTGYRVTDAAVTCRRCIASGRIPTTTAN